jgi:hypothetical protein
VKFVITSEKSTTVTELREELTNAPLDVYYILANVVEEEFELPNIPTHKGTTIIEVDTSVRPSNMEVTYLGKP